jgi:hypothetical protein
MKTDPKVKNLGAIRRWSKHYLGQEEKLVQEGDVDLLKRLADELWDFLDGLKNKRLTDKRLSAATRDELAGLHDQLRRLAQFLATRVTELRRNQEIMRRLESIALPEPAEGVETRDLSTWNMWPFRYCERLRAKLTGARLPQ